MKQKGFTLIELLVVISILSIVMSFAAPSFLNTLKNSRMRSSEGELLTAFKYARTEAIRTGQTTSVSATDDSITSNEWGSGLSVSAVTPRMLPSFNDTMTLDGTNGVSTISYSPNGMTDLAATFVINVCDDRTAETGRQISILVTGMISVNSNYTCP